MSCAQYIHAKSVAGSDRAVKRRGLVDAYEQRGGCMLTEVTVDAVMPKLASPQRVVMTDTVDARRRIAERNCLAISSLTPAAVLPLSEGVM